MSGAAPLGGDGGLSLTRLLARYKLVAGWRSQSATTFALTTDPHVSGLGCCDFGLGNVGLDARDGAVQRIAKRRDVSGGLGAEYAAVECRHQAVGELVKIGVTPRIRIHPAARVKPIPMWPRSTTHTRLPCKCLRPRRGHNSW